MILLSKVFGELGGKEIAAAGSGNLALRDQRLALEWVQVIHIFFEVSRPRTPPKKKNSFAFLNLGFSLASPIATTLSRCFCFSEIHQ